MGSLWEKAYGKSLWEAYGKKREKNILPTRLLEKKIIDDKKSPTSPPPPTPSRVEWSAPKYTQTTVLYSHISISNIWINELGYRIPK